MVTQEELGRRIAEARQRAALTQEQVADALRVPRTAITQLESGNRQVSSLEIVEMGRLFGVDVRDLLEGKNAGEELVTLFRSKGAGADPAAERAVKECQPICQAVADVEDLIEEHDPVARTARLGTYPLRALPGDPRTQGQTLARLERDRLRLGPGPIPDLSLLAMQSGLVVAEHGLPEEIYGIFLRARNGRSFILLHEEETYGRKRSSLAHRYLPCVGRQSRTCHREQGHGQTDQREKGGRVRISLPLA